MKPVPPHALCLIAARDRQQLRHPGQIVVKRGVETGHLGQVGKPVMKRLCQQYLLRQMLGIKWIKPMQFRNHFRGDSLRLAILRPAMHYAMSHGGQAISRRSSIQSMRTAHRGRVVRRRHRAREVIRLVDSFRMPCGIRQADPLNPARQNALERFPGLEQGELDAR